MAGTNKLLKIDIGGKQGYIFSCNKLKAVVGASWVMGNKVFEPLEEIAISHPGLSKVYEGGGNALYQYNNETDIEKIITQYSSKIIKYFPGIQLEFGMALNDTSKSWKDRSHTLNKDLIKNKNQNYTECRPYKTGIAADCPFSGEAQEESYQPSDNEPVQWISKEVKVKIGAAKASNNDFQRKVGDVFHIPLEIDEIGDDDDKSYVAVVHIDGNGLGSKFMNCTDLSCTECKKEVKDVSSNTTCLSCLSRLVKHKLESSMNYLVEKVIIPLFDKKGAFDHNNDDSEIRLKKISRTKDDNNAHKAILPFRPIINAGDDITFICHGRLGIYLAEEYIKILNDESIGGLSIPSCGGVAIVHTKYPFYRAYELAEKLAGEAKIKSRPQSKCTDITSIVEEIIPEKEQKKNSCWLNFMVAPQGYTGDFKKMLENKYPTRHSRQHGPYLVIDNARDDIPKATISMQTLKQKLQSTVYNTDEKKAWPKNKLMELRANLFKSKADIEYFMEVMKSRKLVDDKEAKGFTNFPYVDLADMLHFYPEPLLDKKITKK